MFRDKSWQFESAEALQQSQKKDRTSIGVVTPREITKVEVIERSEKDARSFEQKFEDLKKTVDAQRAQIQMFEDTIPPEMKKLEFLKSRVVVSWFCKGTLPTSTAFTKCQAQNTEFFLFAFGQRVKDIEPHVRQRAYELCGQ